MKERNVSDTHLDSKLQSSNTTLSVCEKNILDNKYYIYTNSVCNPTQSNSSIVQCRADAVTAVCNPAQSNVVPTPCRAHAVPVVPAVCNSAQSNTVCNQAQSNSIPAHSNPGVQESGASDVITKERIWKSYYQMRLSVKSKHRSRFKMNKHTIQQSHSFDRSHSFDPQEGCFFESDEGASV